MLWCGLHSLCVAISIQKLMYVSSRMFSWMIFPSILFGLQLLLFKWSITCANPLIFLYFVSTFYLSTILPSGNFSHSSDFWLLQLLSNFSFLLACLWFLRAGFFLYILFCSFYSCLVVVKKFYFKAFFTLQRQFTFFCLLLSLFFKDLLIHACLL